MSELRKDPIVDRWVIVAPERGQRPSDVHLQPGRQPPNVCPFCPGHERMTPNEVLAYRHSHTLPNTPGWTVRVVPNKYPALGPDGALRASVGGLFGVMNGVGAHEVIIETSDHEASLATLPMRHVEQVLWAFRSRLQELRQDRRLQSGLIFKNYGAAAGATLQHPHSQLIALPIVPKSLREELEGSGRYYREHGRCLFCDLVVQEVRLECRVIVENAAFIALAPFASRFPFEMWILPRRHAASFETGCGEAYGLLAMVLQKVLYRAYHLLNDPAYNLVLHSAPWRNADEGSYHWHLEIIPRLTGVAGFEWGTGFFINSITPEAAARALRGVSEGERD
jgi:UDPglucose--hexose-1-phosphate uridylyltransferase